MEFYDARGSLGSFVPFSLSHGSGGLGRDGSVGNS